jgi:hypothetical protein
MSVPKRQPSLPDLVPANHHYFVFDATFSNLQLEKWESMIEAAYISPNLPLVPARCSKRDYNKF